MKDFLSGDFYSKENAKGFIRTDIKQNKDEILLVLKISELPLAEYAVVFELDSAEYVAGILNVTKRSCIHNLKVDLNKIRNFKKIKIVNIYSEKELFYLDNFLNDTQNNEEEIKEEDNQNNMNQEDFEDITEEEFFEEDDMLDIENIDEQSEEDFFMYTYEKVNQEEINEDNLITFDNKLLEKNFKKVNLKFFNSSLDYDFYIVDLSYNACYDLNVIYNGFIMPVIYPFMGYSNDKFRNTAYPSMIFGKIRGEHNNFFVYGILGSPNKESQPFLGSTGFIYFERLKNEEIGYWIMFISESTGKISIPLKPKS